MDQVDIEEKTNMILSFAESRWLFEHYVWYSWREKAG